MLQYCLLCYSIVCYVIVEQYQLNGYIEGSPLRIQRRFDHRFLKTKPLWRPPLALTQQRTRHVKTHNKRNKQAYARDITTRNLRISCTECLVCFVRCAVPTITIVRYTHVCFVRCAVSNHHHCPLYTCVFCSLRCLQPSPLSVIHMCVLFVALCPTITIVRYTRVCFLRCAVSNHHHCP